MAETQTKRQRGEEEEEETHNQNFEEIKRHKSYNQILSILEEDEVEATEDLSSIFTTLQQELSSDDFDPLLGPISDSGADPQSQTTASLTSDFSKEDEDDEKEKERVIRHLLEASDDELGLPHRSDGGGDDYEINGSDHGVSFCDGFWEFEDEAANYYTLLQSELFR
ncbi:hypothetical protein LguiA_032656 [Lonicera macranthoides]